MKFRVYYTDDRSHAETIEANTREMAAWKFVQAHPRQQAVQLAVASPPEAIEFAGTVLWRSEAFQNQPPPSDEQEPDLVIDYTGGREPSYEICGTMDSLRLLANQLLSSLDEFPGKPDPHNSKFVYGVGILPADRTGFASSLCFIADPNRRSPAKSETIRCLLLLMLLGFAGIGIWTAIKWLF